MAGLCGRADTVTGIGRRPRGKSSEVINKGWYINIAEPSRLQRQRGKKWDLSPRQKQNRFLMGPRWQHAARLSRISVRKKKEEEEANIWSANPSQATSVWFVINGWGVEAHWVRDQYSSSRQICSYSRWLIVTTRCRRPPPSSSSSDEQCIIPFRNTVIKLLLCMTKQKAAMFFF